MHNGLGAEPDEWHRYLEDGLRRAPTGGDRLTGQ